MDNITSKTIKKDYTDIVNDTVDEITPAELSKMESNSVKNLPDSPVDSGLKSSVVKPKFYQFALGSKNSLYAYFNQRMRSLNEIISGVVTDVNGKIENDVVAQLNDIVDDINTVVSAINTLNGAIETEASNRASAITSAISSEVDNRNSAITSAISNEESNRNSAITSAISEEVTNRNSAITSATTSLQTKAITFNNEQTTILNVLTAIATQLSEITGDTGSSLTSLVTLNTKIEQIEGILNSDIENFDTLQEIADFLSQNQNAQDIASHINNTSNPHNVTASQVGARPDTWTPTASDVGARPNTWTPSASDVGAYTKAEVDTKVGDLPTYKDEIIKFTQKQLNIVKVVAEANGDKYIDISDIATDVVFTISFNTNVRYLKFAESKNASSGSFTQYSNVLSASIMKPAYSKLYLFDSSWTLLDPDSLNTMLTIGNTAYPYQAPTGMNELPTYAKELNKIAKEQANLFDINNLAIIKTQSCSQSVSNNNLTITNSGAWSEFIVNINTEIGKAYTLGYNFTNAGASTVRVQLFDSNSGELKRGDSSTATSGSYSLSFVATTILTKLQFHANYSGTSNTNSVVFSNIMLNEGSIPYPYQPYNASKHITNEEASLLSEEKSKVADTVNYGKIMHEVEVDSKITEAQSNLDATNIGIQDSDLGQTDVSTSIDEIHRQMESTYSDIEDIKTRLDSLGFSQTTFNYSSNGSGVVNIIQKQGKYVIASLESVGSNMAQVCIPEGYRPKDNLTFICAGTFVGGTSGTYTVCYVTIGTDGNITCKKNTTDTIIYNITSMPYIKMFNVGWITN